MEQRKGLAARIRGLFSFGSAGQALYPELEEVLLEADLGPILAHEAVEELKRRTAGRRLSGREELTAALKGILAPGLKSIDLRPEPGRLSFFLVLGVNGVGKTTTIAKLADYYRRCHGLQRILLSAADTFRAAAIEQLVLWAERLRLPVIHQDNGADPGAVIFDSLASAQARAMELVLADTAGRMHNQAQLVKELAKIDKIITGKIGAGAYRKILVLDATTGQNALRQAEAFHAAIRLDAIILAKYDSTARGGIVLAVCRQLKLPIAFLGTGERLTDLVPFEVASFLDGLVGEP